MLGRINTGCLILVLAGALLVPPPRLAQAQALPVVTAYYPAAPVVTYLPERRGPLGLRTVYRPVMSYPVAAAVPVAPAPVTAYYAPPVTTYYAPPVTTYYAPPVTTYYAPPVAATVHYAPVAPATTAYYPPAPVTTYYAPPAPLVVPAPAPVTVRYAPVPVVPYSVILP